MLRRYRFCYSNVVLVVVLVVDVATTVTFSSRSPLELPFCWLRCCCCCLFRDRMTCQQCSKRKERQFRLWVSVFSVTCCAVLSYLGFLFRKPAAELRIDNLGMDRFDSRRFSFSFDFGFWSSNRTIVSFFAPLLWIDGSLIFRRVFNTLLAP